MLVLALSLEVLLTPRPAIPADTLGTAFVLLLKLVVPALAGWGGIGLVIHSAHWPGKDQEPG